MLINQRPVPYEYLKHVCAQATCHPHVHVTLTHAIWCLPYIFGLAESVKQILLWLCVLLNLHSILLMLCRILFFPWLGVLLHCVCFVHTSVLEITWLLNLRGPWHSVSFRYAVVYHRSGVIFLAAHGQMAMVQTASTNWLASKRHLCLHHVGYTFLFCHFAQQPCTHPIFFWHIAHSIGLHFFIFFLFSGLEELPLYSRSYGAISRGS